MDRPRTTYRVSSDVQEFQPPSEWVRDDKFETIVVKLPGFRKEQIKVQINDYRILTASGERPVQSGGVSRFRREFTIPDNLDISQIRAKFDNGNLYVIIPKMITEAESQDQLPRPQEHAKSEAQPGATQKATTGKVAEPEAQPGATQKATTGKVAEPEAQPDMTQKATTGKSTKPEAQPDATQKTTIGKTTKPDMTQKATAGGQNTRPRQPVEDDMKETPLMKDKEKENVKAPYEEPADTGKAESGGWKEGEGDEGKKGAVAAVKEKVNSGGGGIGAQIGRWPEKAMAGVGGVVQGLQGSPRQLVVNIGAAVMVLVTLGIYMTYKVKKAAVAESD